MRLFGDENVFGSLRPASRACVVDSDLVGRVQGDFANLPDIESLSDSICEVVNLRGMEDWDSTGMDRRQEQLSQYIDWVKKYGAEREDFDGVFPPRQDYRRELGVGRTYCSWISLQQRTRECRPSALSGLPWRVYELHQVNCQPRLLPKYIRDNAPSCRDNFQILSKYFENPDKWKKAIADYYGYPIAKGKKLLIRIIYGAHYATGVAPDVLICPKGLYLEVRNAIEQLKQDASFTSNMQLPNVVSDERPEYSALSIFLGGMEYDCTSFLKKSLEGRGYEVISLVHDGVYFACPDSRCVSEDFKILRGEISEAFGVDVSIKDLSGEKVCTENISNPTGWVSIENPPLG